MEGGAAPPPVVATASNPNSARHPGGIGTGCPRGSASGVTLLLPPVVGAAAPHGVAAPERGPVPAAAPATEAPERGSRRDVDAPGAGIGAGAANWKLPPTCGGAASSRLWCCCCCWGCCAAAPIVLLPALPDPPRAAAAAAAAAALVAIAAAAAATL